jgi:hypothetical protein
MSFASHVNNTCFIPTAINHPQALTNKNSGTLKPANPGPTPQTVGVMTKISEGKPAESVTYPAPSQQKVSISDVAVGTLVSAVGGVVGAGIGSYMASKLDNTRDNTIMGGVLGGLAGASSTPGNVLDVLNVPSRDSFPFYIGAFCAGAVFTLNRPQQAQNLMPNVINNALLPGPGIHA